MPQSHKDQALELTLRDTGKSAAKGLRRQGHVPAVVYGGGSTPLAVAFVAEEFVRGGHLEGGPMVSVRMPDGTSSRVLLREVRRSPLTGRLEHVDFQRVGAGESVRSEIRVILDDDAPLLKKGLVTSWVQDHVQVEGPPEDLPERLTIQASTLDFGGQVLAKDLPLPPSIRLLTDAESVLLVVTAPKTQTMETTTAAPGAASGEGAEGSDAEVDANQ